MRGVSICQFTMLPASFEDDVAAYRAAGAEGIGICELKLAQGREDEQRRLVQASGLAVTACVPAVPSILPLPLMAGPDDRGERVEAIEAAIRRLAPFEPTCVFFLTGPGDDRDALVEGIRSVADAGREAGVRVALEPMQREVAQYWTSVSSLGEAAALADEAGRADVGLLFDTWHLWNQPNLLDEIARYRDRILGVHVADWRRPTRNTNDRVLPGDGVVDLNSILAALAWDGFHDLEIFSDSDLPDSLWKLDPPDLARRGVAAMRAVLA